MKFEYLEVLMNWRGLCKLAFMNEKLEMLPTFNLWNKAKALLEVGADAVEAPTELGVTAVLVGAAGVVAHVQLVAALGHGRDPHIHLAHNRGDSVCEWVCGFEFWDTVNIDVTS